jgi:hypothetical protein
MGLFRPKPAPYSQTRTLTAAAAPVRLNDRATVEGLQARRSTSLWQDDAWAYYDAIGEVKYAFGLVASILSRIRLYPAVVVDADSVPVAVADAIVIERPEGEVAGADEVDRLVSGRGIDPRLAKDARDVMSTFATRTSIATMMSAATLNLQVAGECYLASIPEDTSTPGWRVYSTSELVVGAGGTVSLRTSQASGAGSQGGAVTVDPNTALIGRIWRPHPRFNADPDSSMRAVRSDCEELLLLDRMIRSTVRSRMNAGILFVPDALTVAARTPPDELDLDSTEPEDTFDSELMSAMLQPVADDLDASAVVPLLVRGPAELGREMVHLSLSRDVSTQLMDRALKVLERILQGLDVPKEIVQGLADVKYSNALVINDGLYRATIEPMALLIADSITAIMLRPMLRAMGHDPEQVARVVVWYDPSEVVSKPDPAEAANQGFDRFLLSGDAWRQAHGFSDAEAPDSAELARRLAIEKTSIAPEVGQVLMEVLLPDILGKAREENIAEGGGFPPELDEALGGAPGAPSGPEGPPAPEAPPETPEAPAQPSEGV